MDEDPKFFDLEALDRYEFKEAMRELFERLDYEAKTAPKSAEEGRDLVLEKEDRRTLVACRNLTSPAGRPTIQNLHSVLVSDREAGYGLVINPGGFSEEAEDRAGAINEEGDFQVELWGLEALEAHGQDAGIHFHSWPLETYVFFHVPWNEESAIPDVFAARYLDALNSAPRDPVEAIDLRDCDRTYLPAIEVDYAVDKRFTASNQEIYHARETGTMVFLVGGHSIDEVVQRFIEESPVQHLEETELQGDAPASFFRGNLDRYRSRVSDQVSRQLSRTVEYTASNDQTYTRDCEVKPYDVDVNVRQLFVAQNYVAFEAGPRDYSIEALDSKDADWQFRDESTGFDAGDEGLRERNGYLCSDCGLIVPESEGDACSECERTLCSDHRWRWPSKLPRSWSTLCSACYEERDPTTHKLTAGPLDGMPWTLVPLGLIPGLSFLVGQRKLEAAALIILTLLLEAAVLFWPPLAGLSGRQFVLLLPVAISLFASIYWLVRLRAYRSTTEALEDYTPAWS